MTRGAGPLLRRVLVRQRVSGTRSQSCALLFSSRVPILDGPSHQPGPATLGILLRPWSQRGLHPSPECNDPALRPPEQPAASPASRPPALGGFINAAHPAFLQCAISGNGGSFPSVLAQSHCPLRRFSAVPQENDPDPDADTAEQRSPPTERVRRLVDEIADLTLLEVADLTTLLKRKLGLPEMPMGMGMGMMPMGMPMAGPGAVPGADGSTPVAEPVVEKTSFDVKLEKFEAASKLKVIKEVRAITGLGLKESKELVEGAPAIIKKGVAKDEAESIAEKLKAVGAEIALE